MTEPDQVAADVTTAGELLRAAREQQGVHLAVLAASLKVAPRKLELLESNRYEELPDPTFARALALSMCRALKIDPEPVLVRLPQPHSHRFETMAGGLNQPFRDREAPGADGIDWRRFLTLPILAAAVLVVGAVVIYLAPPRMPSSEKLPLPASAPASPEPEPAASVAAAPSAVAAGASAPAAPVVPAVPVPAAPLPDALAPAAAVPAAPAVAEAVPPEAAASAAGEALSLRAEAASWVEVRDRNNQVLLSRTLGAGETAGLDGTPPLRLVIGNAQGTRVSFRGQPVSLAPATKDNVARLELK
jgi:cytoskeleton protein RodZ